jgi:hypothetical protein
MDPFHRAVMIRDDADRAFRACELQHSRVVNFRQPLPGESARDVMLRGRVDVDFFVVALNRLHFVADLAREVADPATCFSKPWRRSASAPLASRCGMGSQTSMRR